MNDKDLQDFLKKGGLSKSAIKRSVRFVKDFEDYLELNRGSKALQDANMQDLDDFVDRIESEPKASAKTHLWALRYYFDFTNNDDLHYLAGALREERIQRTAFLLKDFRGVDPDNIEKLAAVGIKSADQMLKKGRTPQNRKELSEKTGVWRDKHGHGDHDRRYG